MRVDGGSSASQALINKVANGEPLTPAEAQAALDAPELQDAFSSQTRADLTAYAQGGALPPRLAAELTSNLALLKKAGEVPERFAADFVLAQPSLLDHPAFTQDDKAQRMFDFAAPYVETLAELAKTPEEQKDAGAKLLQQADGLGYGALRVQPSGTPLMELLREATEEKSPEDVRLLLNGVKVDAPSWPQLPDAAKLQAQQVFQRQVERKTAAEDDDPQKRRDRTSDRVLGPKMLWNVLHLFRDDGRGDRESAAQRDAMTQLAIAALGILALMGILIAILVAL